MSSSIAMCTYNGERYIREQLESILTQTIPPTEIIICDDCSKDKTIEIARNILKEWDGKWKIICNKKNLGYKMNFQKAISLCSGEIIFLSDQDDIWVSNKIEIMLQCFNNPDTILAFHDAELVDQDANLLYPSFWETMPFDVNRFLNKNYSEVLVRNVMQGAACCFRKSLFKLAFPFPELAIHDEWLFLNGLLNGKVVPVKKSLIKYRQARNAIGGLPDTTLHKIYKWTTKSRQTITTQFRELKRRYYVLKIFRDQVQNRHSSTNDDFKTFFVSLKEYVSFTEKRLNSIHDKTFDLILSYPKYCHFYGEKANKALVKDLLKMMVRNE